jgi:hypothetical protein
MRARLLKWLLPEIHAEREQAQRDRLKLAELDAEKKATQFYRPRNRGFEIIGDSDAVVEYARSDPYFPQRD